MATTSAMFWRSLRSFSSDVRVRFAPSPTGNLHLGGLRTALYNFLYARANNGIFVLRIEDTDQKRSVHETIEMTESALKRYGLKYDEGPSCGGEFGPYIQSQRKSSYMKAALKLLESGHAYRCFCSQTRMEMLRREAARRHEVPKYDNHCRDLSDKQIGDKLANGTPFTIRFKLKNNTVGFEDENYGQIQQKTDEGDFVIMKSDNFPTYHLANVVDDHAMHISHVIRGLEWLTSTSKHVQIYQSFGWTSPSWIHLPLIVRSSNKKLSKRDKDAYVDYYDVDKGYLPIAVLNYLIRNGSGIRDFDRRKLYTLDEMIERFDAKLIGKRSIMLDQLQLDQYGCMAIETLDREHELIAQISERLQRIMPDADVLDHDYIRRVLELCSKTDQKVPNLSALIDGDFRFYFMRPTSAEHLLKNCDRQLAFELLNEMINEQQYSIDAIKSLAARRHVSKPIAFKVIRLALIDSVHGPPIADLLDFFGSVECKKRFSRMIRMLRQTSSIGAV